MIDVDPFAPSLLQRLPEPPRKVALLRASRIGDFVCATPAFRAIRQALPEADITIVTLPMLRDLAVRSPHFDRFAPFPGYPGLAEQLFNARDAVKFFQEMQAEHFDLAVQMQGSGVNSNPFTLLLGARWTAGYVRAEDAAGRLDAALPIPLHGHEIERVLALTSFLGIPPDGVETEYPLWPEDDAAAEQLLSGARAPMIGLHAGAQDKTRCWPLDRFARVGRELQDHFGGTVVLVGSSEERDNAEKIARQIGEQARNLAGRTSLGALGAVLKRLALLITNDSGPAHVAYALRVPTITIFGGGDLGRYGPFGEGPYHVLLHEIACRPCYHSECPIGFRCLKEVTAGEVVEAARESLSTP